MDDEMKTNRPKLTLDDNERCHDHTGQPAPDECNNCQQTARQIRERTALAEDARVRNADAVFSAVTRPGASVDKIIRLNRVLADLDQDADETVVLLRTVVLGLAGALDAIAEGRPALQAQLTRPAGSIAAHIDPRA